MPIFRATLHYLSNNGGSDRVAVKELKLLTVRAPANEVGVGPMGPDGCDSDTRCLVDWRRLLVLVLLVGLLNEGADANVGLLDVFGVFVAVLLAAHGADGDVVEDDVLHRLALVAEDAKRGSGF